MKRIYFFTNYFPLYRKAIWNLLINENKYDFHIFYSKKERQGIRQHKTTKDKKLHVIKNIFFRKYLIWQSGALKKFLFDPIDIVVFIGEFNVVSTWIGVIICKLRFKKIWFWGHGVYGNEGYIKKTIRLFFLSLADKNLVYEKRAKNLLMENGFDPSKIEVVYNSLDYSTQKKYFNKYINFPIDVKIFNNKYPIILYFGRLTFNKKINLLLESVKSIQENIPVNLLIIGEGEAKNSLEKQSRNLSLKHTIFYGSLYDEEEIAKMFLISKICVSPGNVGLNAIHSISYGTPIVTHNNFNNQMPEVESIKEGKSGYFFKENDISSLTKAIKKALINKGDRRKIRSIIDLKYNPFRQKKIFDRLILKQKSKSKFNIEK